MQRKGKGEHTTRFICLAWQNLGHLTPPDIYQPLCCRDTPQTCHPSPNWGSRGREAGCSWMLNKLRASQGSLSPSSNHIWFLFPQLTHPLRCIPLCWISQIARFKGKKKTRAHNYSESENSSFGAERSWRAGAKASVWRCST